MTSFIILYKYAEYSFGTICTTLSKRATCILFIAMKKYIKDKLLRRLKCSLFFPYIVSASFSDEHSFEPLIYDPQIKLLHFTNTYNTQSLFYCIGYGPPGLQETKEQSRGL